MLPGMERRLTEHMMVHHCAASEASGRSLQEVPLLKGSFGHHSAIGGLGNSSSQESLYGNQRHHIMTSGSLHSIRSSRPTHQPGAGHTAATASIPVTAEIVPVPMQNSQADQANVILASSASSGAITSSSFMPSIAVSEAAAASAAVSVSGSTTNTLPRSLENGYNRSRLTSASSPPPMPPVFVEAAGRTSMAMATMPRHHMHHISNGNGLGGAQWTGSPPPPPPPPHHPGSSAASGLAGSSATLPIKKKSVTIGTFTTVMEPFEISEEENMISSVV